MSKFIVKELFLLRSVACLAVVIIHAIYSVFVNFGIRKAPDYMEINYVLFVFQILLMFGTPMFVFISEFILANAYKGKVPKGFFRKRLKFIFVPFIVIGLFNTLIVTFQHNDVSSQLFFSKLYEQFVLGYFHGYFVLIIFQFYLLHFLFTKYIDKKFNMKYVIIVSLIINILYLGYFNFIEPNPTFPFHLLFIAWVGYFTVAYYSGKYFDKFKATLQKYKKIVIIAPFVTSFIVLLLCYSSLLTYIQSKRVDMIIHTMAMAFFLFYLGMKMKSIPRPLVKISQYSFGIYLLHPFFFLLSQSLFTNTFSIGNLILYFVFATSLALLGSMACIYLLNQFKFGSYIVGKVGIGIKPSSPTNPHPVHHYKENSV
ncbi:acyltransferase family protein [Bacillus spongiae]|uniref:Acyltransferase family protein n=1 Tax=Bacillus spongiae TaxID=2683610 RepID=A0ABU8HG37_9BACI